jgi:hypothetical protein
MMNGSINNGNGVCGRQDTRNISAAVYAIAKYA